MSVLTVAVCSHYRCSMGPCIINQLASISELAHHGCENNILNIVLACPCILSLAQYVAFWCHIL